MEENMHPDFLDEEEPMEPEKKQFSVKSFFKSTAFKCIYVLLAIVLVCGVLLAFCNDLFEVTAEERLARAISKIYGSNVTATDAIEDDMTLEFGNGEVEEAYAIKEDGNYLVKATGTGGFSGGTVTLWVVVEISDDNKVDGVGKVVIDSNVGQSYINRVSDSHLEYFGDNFSSEESFNVSDWQLSSGPTVTLTATAIVNAVNTALEFVRTQLLGEVIVPDEPSPFEDFNYYSEKYISDDTTVELADDETSVIFHITTGNIVTGASKVDITVSSEGVITDYTIVSEGTTAGDQYLPHVNDVTEYVGKSAADILPLLGTAGEGGFAPETSDSTLHGGATYTNFYYAYAAMFAASNYQNGYVMALENSVQYTQYIDMENTTVEVSGTDVIYHITTKNIVTGASKVDITVNSEGVITGYTIVSEGTTAGDQYLPHVNDVTEYVGKSAADILPLLGTAGEGGFAPETSDSTLHGGATYTNFYYAYAAMFAASNYEIYPLIEEARLNLEMSNVYGESVVVEAVSLDGLTATVGKGTVNTVYSVMNTGDYIVSATGTEGFEGGTVTCWVVVETENGAVSGIKKVVIASNDKQSYIGYITDATLGHFTDAFNGSDFAVSDWKSNNITGGATASTTAIVNSVNSAMNFVSANLISGGENA